MKNFQLPGSPTGSPGVFTKSEKKRLLVMVLGVFFVAIALWTSFIKARAYRDSSGAELPSGLAEFEETVHLPEIDVAAIEPLVREDAPEDRVLIDNEALDLLMKDARGLTLKQFEAMDARVLDGEAIGELLENPAAHRAEPFTVRGEVDALKSRRRGATNREEHIGRIVLDDGSVAYFVALSVPDLGGYVRFDGLFLKAFSDEDPEVSGSWIDGPLLVGPLAVRSYPDLGRVESLDPADFEDVADAVLVPDEGQELNIVRETPFDPLWTLMAYARDLPEGAVDWEAAPELTQELLMEVEAKPSEWRAQPVRIPISRIQDARVLRANENPARIERYTQGWIGNTTWKNVIHFKAPEVDFDLHIKDHAFGRGFFMHLFAYDSARNELRSAPLFVLESIERFEPTPDPVYVQLGYVIAGAAAGLIGLFFWLLRRDKKKASALQAEMARRRRARQARSKPTDSLGTAPS